MLAVTGQPLRLLLLRERIDTDQDYASRAVWIDGLVLCSDEQGLVRIVTDSSITLVDGRRWINKDLVFEATEDVIQVVPAANPEVVHRLLELCHHHISPGGIGATLGTCSPGMRTSAARHRRPPRVARHFHSRFR